MLSKLLKIYTIGLALIASCSVTHADSIRLGGWSRHFNNTYDYNETHNTVIYEEEKYGYSVGYFYNSYRDDTYFVAKQWRGRLDSNLEWRFSLAAAHGYRSCTLNSADGDKRWCLIPYPEVRITAWKLNPSFIFLGNGAALTLGFQW